MAGIGAYAGFNQRLTGPLLGAFLLLYALAFLGVWLVLDRRLRWARAQRLRSLSQMNEKEWPMCDGRRNQHPCVARCAAWRVQAMQSEIDYLRAREGVLQVQAHHDSLTGLANRLLLADRFGFTVERAKRSGKSFVLFVIDLNDFKSVNDNYGHAAGDAVLVSMARRLVGAVRASDTVARVGGDEFVLMVEAMDDREEVIQIGQKLIETLFDPVMLETGVTVTTGASIGLAMFPQDGSDMEELLQVADQAMYECKTSGLMGLH